jgi:hypothetical protein
LTSATGTGTSFSSVMILWMIRAIRSAPPPTAKGMTNSTSRVGFQSACAKASPTVAARATAAVPARSSRRKTCIASSHVFSLGRGS